MDAAIVLDGVSKSFAGRRAVQRLSLTVRRGEVFGFLGPNGAGKTTTINLILGLLAPDKGRVIVLGEPVRAGRVAWRARLGVVGEQQYIHDEMTARAYLRFFAAIYQVPLAERRIEALMEMVGLQSFLDVQAHDYSHGMKQKLGLARALLHEPDILILDEPVSGLDPAGIAQVRNVLREENRRGATVFLSSHVLSEVECMAQRVGILSRGALVAEDTMEGLRRRLAVEEQLTVELDTMPAELDQAMLHVPGVRRAQVRGTTLVLAIVDDGQTRARVSKAVAAHGGLILGMTRQSLSLEEAFLTLTEQSVSLLTGDQT